MTIGMFAGLEEWRRGALEKARPAATANLDKPVFEAILPIYLVPSCSLPAFADGDAGMHWGLPSIEGAPFSNALVIDPRRSCRVWTFRTGTRNCRYMCSLNTQEKRNDELPTLSRSGSSS